MKKVFALMSIVAMFSMVACGPAKEGNDEAEKKRIEDSIAAANAAAEQAAAEETVATETMDSTSMDSTAAPATEEAAH